MQMGSPNSTPQKVTFRWKTGKDYLKEDIIDQPYDWTATPTATTSHADVIVDVAVEFGRLTGSVTEENAIGNFDSTRAIITVLGEEYALISDADVVLIGGDTYVLNYVQPLALFDQDVYQIHCTALDET